MRARATEAVRAAAERALRRPPASADPGFGAVREARAGEPALVRTEGGEPAFWLVPLVQGTRACGYAQVALSLEVQRIVTLGAGPADRGSWPQASFFEAPPKAVVEEVRRAWPGAVLVPAFLSYDRSPARWGWLLRVRGSRDVAVLITPGGWSEVPASPGLPDRE